MKPQKICFKINSKFFFIKRTVSFSENLKFVARFYNLDGSVIINKKVKTDKFHHINSQPYTNISFFVKNRFNETQTRSLSQFMPVPHFKIIFYCLKTSTTNFIGLTQGLSQNKVETSKYHITKQLPTFTIVPISKINKNIHMEIPPILCLSVQELRMGAAKGHID